MMETNRVRQITELGQAIWLDNLSRQLLDDGTLARTIEEDGPPA
jgi:transaldolase